MGGAVPQKILNWLHSVLAEYHDNNRVYSDVAHIISQYPNFSLRTDVYTYENGWSVLLLNIAGTLPVNFRGTIYMFPISIWVPQEYPKAPPMTFITPTPNMLIRPGQSVSVEGRIYHPYLAGWRDDRSDIMGLLSILQKVFSREPPVISRQELVAQNQRASSIPVSNQNRQPPPIPPLPAELGGSDADGNPPQAALDSPGRPPRLPPKPFASKEFSKTLPNNGLPQLPPHPNTVDKHYRSSQSEHVQDFQKSITSSSQGPNQNPNYFQREHVPTTPTQRITHPYNQQIRQESYSPVSPLTPERKLEKAPSSNEGLKIIWTCCHCKSQYLTDSLPAYCSNCEYPRCNNCQIQPVQQNYSLPGQTPPQPPITTLRPNPVENQWNSGQSQNLQQRPPPNYLDPLYHASSVSQPPLPKPKPVEDLLTSPSETPLPAPTASLVPPPIPPNPQKDAILSALSQTLTQRIQAAYNSNMAAIPPLRAQQSALQSTLTAINNEISQLNDLQSLLSSNEAILHKAMRDADQVMEDAKHREVPGVDEVLVAPTIVAGQLYALVADERSIEDCRGVLSRALDKGRIGGDVWAKQTRSLAREEFLKKALIKKIAQGMGLAEDERWI